MIIYFICFDIRIIFWIFLSSFKFNLFNPNEWKILWVFKTRFTLSCLKSKEIDLISLNVSNTQLFYCLVFDSLYYVYKKTLDLKLSNVIFLKVVFFTRKWVTALKLDC